MHGVRGHHNNPGELRTTQNWIGPGGCTLHDATFVPPPPHEVAKILGQLENFMHGDDQLPMLIKIGLVHAQFETIHPFLDGNGRVGRLLITFLLCQADILQKPVLYLSHYFKKRRIDYYNCLQNVRDDGDWEGWLKFFLRGISEVSNEATDTARKIVSLRENHRGRITDNFGRSAANGHTLLESLFKRPIINVATVAEKLEITFAAANNLVQRFVDQQMLFEITGQQRYRLFSYEPYISLFSQPLHRSSDGP